MKTKLKIIVLVITLSFCGIVKGQDDFLALSSSLFLKGLTDLDYLRNVLNNNGFALTKKWKVKSFKGGVYEYWQYKSRIYVDMIQQRGQQVDIIVRVYKEIPGLPERLTESFPRGSSEIKDKLSDIKVSNLNKEQAYSLKYTENGKNMGIFVWFDDPFYYFEYTMGI